MRWFFRIALLLAACLPSGAVAQMQSSPSSPPTLASVLDVQLSLIEKQFVSAAEAMPGDKYGFVPQGGNFDGVRSFALQVRHVATANMGFYSRILGQAMPPGVDLNGAANGPESLQSREQILQYLKDSFALGHKAVATLTLQDAFNPVTDPPITSMKSRLALATFSVSHAWDHYGQMVEYLRMNGITPPASNGQPPANPQKK